MLGAEDMRAGTTFAALQPGALRIIEATAIPGAHLRFGRVDPALLALVASCFAASQLAALDALGDTRLLICVTLIYGLRLRRPGNCKGGRSDEKESDHG
jgi:hypothetical protein